MKVFGRIFLLVGLLMTIGLTVLEIVQSRVLQPCNRGVHRVAEGAITELKNMGKDIALSRRGDQVLRALGRHRYPIDHFLAQKKFAPIAQEQVTRAVTTYERVYFVYICAADDMSTSFLEDHPLVHKDKRLLDWVAQSGGTTSTSSGIFFRADAIVSGLLVRAEDLTINAERELSLAR